MKGVKYGFVSCILNAIVLLMFYVHMAWTCSRATALYYLTLCTCLSWNVVLSVCVLYCCVLVFFFHKVWLLNTIKKKNYKKRISFPKGSSGWETNSSNHIQAMEGNLPLVNWCWTEGQENNALVEVKGRNYPRHEGSPGPQHYIVTMQIQKGVLVG